jgi:hypothetical protein
MKMNPSDIWMERENKPSYVVDDLAEYCPADIVYESLLRRGVFKWLAVRRDLIRLKDQWGWKITAQIALVRMHKRHNDVYKLGYERGYLKAMEECRAEIRYLCHSARWRAPDNDRRAIKWLEKQEIVCLGEDNE